MSTQTGIYYLWTYSGTLKVLEEILIVTITVFLALSGYCLQGYLLNIFALLALICTAILIIFHVYDVMKKSKLPWHWIECIYVLICAIVFAILASFVTTIFTKGYIATGITAYILSIVYFFDTFDKYRIAVTPSPKYAWTTPNMPDLN